LVLRHCDTDGNEGLAWYEGCCESVEPFEVVEWEQDGGKERRR
jgi:hypothetical protein